MIWIIKPEMLEQFRALSKHLAPKQQALAEQIGISRSSLKRILNGQPYGKDYTRKQLALVIARHALRDVPNIDDRQRRLEEACIKQKYTAVIQPVIKKKTLRPVKHYTITTYFFKLMFLRDPASGEPKYTRTMKFRGDDFYEPHTYQEGIFDEWLYLYTSSSAFSSIAPLPGELFLDAENEDYEELEIIHHDRPVPRNCNDSGVFPVTQTAYTVFNMVNRKKEMVIYVPINAPNDYRIAVDWKALRLPTREIMTKPPYALLHRFKGSDMEQRYGESGTERFVEIEMSCGGGRCLIDEYDLNKAIEKDAKNQPADAQGWSFRPFENFYDRVEIHLPFNWVQINAHRDLLG